MKHEKVKLVDNHTRLSLNRRAPNNSKVYITNSDIQCAKHIKSHRKYPLAMASSPKISNDSLMSKCRLKVRRTAPLFNSKRSSSCNINQEISPSYKLTDKSLDLSQNNTGTNDNAHFIHQELRKELSLLQDIVSTFKYDKEQLKREIQQKDEVIQRLSQDLNYLRTPTIDNTSNLSRYNHSSKSPISFNINSVPNNISNDQTVNSAKITSPNLKHKVILDIEEVTAINTPISEIYSEPLHLNPTSITPKKTYKSISTQTELNKADGSHVLCNNTFLDNISNKTLNNSTTIKSNSMLYTPSCYENQKVKLYIQSLEKDRVNLRERIDTLQSLLNTSNSHRDLGNGHCLSPRTSATPCNSPLAKMKLLTKMTKVQSNSEPLNISSDNLTSYYKPRLPKSKADKSLDITPNNKNSIKLNFTTISLNEDKNINMQESGGSYNSFLTSKQTTDKLSDTLPPLKPVIGHSSLPMHNSQQVPIANLVSRRIAVSNKDNSSKNVTIINSNLPYE